MGTPWRISSEAGVAERDSMTIEDRKQQLQQLLNEIEQQLQAMTEN
jgi:hypothetical protein